MYTLCNPPSLIYHTKNDRTVVTHAWITQRPYSFVIFLASSVAQTHIIHSVVHLYFFRVIVESENTIKKKKKNDLRLSRIGGAFEFVRQYQRQVLRMDH